MTRQDVFALVAQLPEADQQWIVQQTQGLILATTNCENRAQAVAAARAVRDQALDEMENAETPK